MKQPRSTINTLAVALATLALSACATVPRSPSEQRLETQSEWFSSSHLQGCLLGAALGGGGCALAGGNTATCVASALAGCGLGLTAAEYMTQKRQQYANQEQFLQSVITDVRQDNQRVSSYVATQQQVVNENLAKLAQLEQDYAQHKISLDEAKKRKAVLRKTQALLEKKLDDLRHVDKQWQDRYAVATDPRIGQEVQTLQQQVNAADQEVRGFTQKLDVSTVSG